MFAVLSAVWWTLSVGLPIANPAVSSTRMVDTLLVRVVDTRPRGQGPVLVAELVAEWLAPQLPGVVLQMPTGQLPLRVGAGTRLLELQVRTYDLSFRGTRWHATLDAVARVADFVTGSPRFLTTAPVATTAAKHNWKGQGSGRDALNDVVKQAAATLAGMVTAEAPPMTTLAMRDSSAYTPYLLSGTATITGQAFLMTRGGDSKRAAGQDVFLDPVTDYLRSFQSQLGNDVLVGTLVPGDSLFLRARRTTVADADGRFTFRELPAGTYLLSTRVLWEAPTGGGLSLEGGIIAETVRLLDGERREVIVRRALERLPDRLP